MKTILIIWGNWGPYHYARFRSLHDLAQHAGVSVHGLELFPTSGVYKWDRPLGHDAVHHFRIGDQETRFHPVRLARQVLPFLHRLSPDVVFVPSYWHWSLFLNIASRLRGARVIMMNESHGGTERARGWRKCIKRIIVRSFHGGLVGGSPHKRHFSSLGLDPSRLFRGYDAIDNDYFDSRSREVRRNATEVRRRLGLPEKYFLSLGRLVEKKNLATLVRGYALFRKRQPQSPHHLVFVGSGEKEEELRSLCRELELPVQEHPPNEPAENRPAGAPAVHFYGFRQIEENPCFYALASAFILASIREEWGLVVNEAMACSLPVIASRTIGAAEDLVIDGKTGSLFDPSSPSELARCLDRLSDGPLAARLGREAWRHIQHWGCETFACNALQLAELAFHGGPVQVAEPAADRAPPAKEPAGRL